MKKLTKRQQEQWFIYRTAVQVEAASWYLAQALAIAVSIRLILEADQR